MTFFLQIIWSYQKKAVPLHPLSKRSNGPLAQLNRVPHYGCGGCRFESCTDHKKDREIAVFFCACIFYLFLCVFCLVFCFYLLDVAILGDEECIAHQGCVLFHRNLIHIPIQTSWEYSVPHIWVLHLGIATHRA